jgi:hypothetical protein
MPQLNGALMDASLSVIFVFLLVNDIIALADQLDDEMLSYNNYILLNIILKAHGSRIK